MEGISAGAKRGCVFCDFPTLTAAVEGHPTFMSSFGGSLGGHSKREKRSVVGVELCLPSFGLHPVSPQKYNIFKDQMNMSGSISEMFCSTFRGNFPQSIPLFVILTKIFG